MKTLQEKVGISQSQGVVEQRVGTKGFTTRMKCGRNVEERISTIEQIVISITISTRELCVF